MTAIFCDRARSNTDPLMRRFPLVSPLFTLSLLLSSGAAFSQEVVEEDGDEEEVVAADEEETVAADEEETVAADEGDEEEVVAADDEETVAPEEEETAPAGATAAPAGTEGASFEPGEEPWRAPPAGKSVIWGRLYDKKSGEAALEATVTVKGKDVQAVTDFDGYYRLELPPGTYDLEFFYEMYEPMTIGGVTARAGAVTQEDGALTGQEGAVEELVIEDEAETQSIEGLALKRQRAVASGDAVGREEISKGTDSNAAEAAQRVVGANIVGGRFVYVRGLGERYSNSLLSGYPLPSPEPDRAAVPLDVFPAAVLDSITIVKVFTPDMPADFAGGSVQIETRSVPAEPLLNIKIQGGINSQATFQNRSSSPGGGLDWLGFDDGTRALPNSAKTDYLLRGGSEKPDGSQIESDELVEVGRDINKNAMGLDESATPIDHGFSVVGGNTWTFKRGEKIGVLASLNYSHTYEKYDDWTLRQFQPDTEDPRGVIERQDYTVDTGVEKIRWGAFGKVSFLPDPHHKLTLTGLHSQLADARLSVYEGFDLDTSATLAASQNSWVERGLSMGMLGGNHEFRSLGGAKLDWDASLARAYRDEPDRRDTVYSYNDRFGGYVYQSGSESGRHFWAAQTEDSYGGKLDWTQPIAKGTNVWLAKFGGLVNLKERAFEARRFSYRSTNNRDYTEQYVCDGETYAVDCPNSLFIDDNIGAPPPPGPDYRALYLDESTVEGDFYDAHLHVYSGYAMLDVDFAETLHVVAGARVEVTDQAVDPLDFERNIVEDKAASLDSTDVLPAVALAFSATKNVKTRMSYAQTLARPQVRELAPFVFSDYFGGPVTSGNPNLELTYIHNVDARVEYWFEVADVAALSTFYKNFQAPIEPVLIATGGGSPLLTYRNADSANLIGLELELRKGLGFIAEPLTDFSFITNFTATYSRTEIPESERAFLTSASRAMVNQAPWVFNAALNYEADFGMNARITYNVNGTTLTQVGANGMPDSYLHPRHSLDLSIAQKFLRSWDVQFQIQNITNDDWVTTLGKEEQEDLITRQYTEGAIFQLSLGYQLDAKKDPEPTVD